MRIPSADIPQADILPDVARMAEAVHEGQTSFQEMAAYIGKVDRQGRYYRRAAEIVGFIRNEQNQSRLTALGRAYFAAPRLQRESLLRRAVLSTRVMTRMIPFFEGHRGQGVGEDQIRNFLADVTETTPNMIERRTKTIKSWLLAIGIIEQRHAGRFYLTDNPRNIDVVEVESDDEPLFPRAYNLQEYDNMCARIRSRRGVITRFVDETRMERANEAHRHLINLMADRIRAVRGIPKMNPLIDLSAEINQEIFLFEMKSTAEDNVRAQVRKGLSQLYEYRYIQDVERARLVLVLENPPAGEESWLVEYLQNDRDILVVWDGNDRFNCPPEARAVLRFIFV